MAKYNVFTGQLDYTGVPVKTDSAIPAQTGTNGDLQTQFVSSEGRLYFRVNDTLYYVVGTQQAFAAPSINIKRGQPIGLMGVTYADDVT